MAVQSGYEAFPQFMLTGPFQMYFNGLDQLAQNMGPMKGVARLQLEMAGFMSRRAQAYLEIPSRLSRCRTPQDLMTEQLRFWQMAFQQYNESSRRVMDAWAQMATPSGFAGLAANGQGRARDYISFGDERAAGASPAPLRNGRDRHAA
jgi:hypothetical protein